MKRREIQGIEVELGSGNVFADLGLPNAEELEIKSGLAIKSYKPCAASASRSSRPV